MAEVHLHMFDDDYKWQYTWSFIIKF